MDPIQQVASACQQEVLVRVVNHHCSLVTDGSPAPSMMPDEDLLVGTLVSMDDLGNVLLRNWSLCNNGFVRRDGSTTDGVMTEAEAEVPAWKKQRHEDGGTATSLRFIRGSEIKSVSF